MSIARSSARVPAPVCAATRSAFEFAPGLIRLSLFLSLIALPGRLIFLSLRGEMASLGSRCLLVALLSAIHAADARQVCGQDPGSPRWCAEVPDEPSRPPGAQRPADTSRARANAVNEQGRQALAAGRFEEALKFFAQAYSIDPQPVFDNNRKLASISIAARAAASRNDYSREAALWDEANKLFPDGYYAQQGDRARRDAQNRLLDQSVSNVERQVDATDGSIGEVATVPYLRAPEHRRMATFDDDRSPAANRVSSVARAPTKPSLADAASRSEARVLVRQRIVELQSAYERIRTSVAADASANAEWLELSKEASRDAYMSGVDLALFHAAEKAKDNLRMAQKELSTAEATLINATGSDRRSQLHSAVGALANRRDEIQRELVTLERGQRALGILNIYEAKTKAEVIWGVAEQLGALPPIASLAKTVADAAYDVHVQVLAVKQVAGADSRSDAYLKAVAVLDKRMKDLVAQEKRFR